MSQVAESILPADYQAARERAAFYIVPEAGTLEISGETRLDYLQRQTTNDLGLLSATRALPNLLTSASGRILEVFTVVAHGEAIGLLTEPGHAPGLAEYFKRKIFFNDQVAVEDKSAQWAQVELHGPQAGKVLISVGFVKAPPLDEVGSINFDSNDLRAIGRDGLQDPLSFTLLLPMSALDQLTMRLRDYETLPLSGETRELLRIEAGKPGSPEFSDQFTPFEIGLERYVSAEKGCYTGQEVLARQVTYAKVVRRLVQLCGEQPMLPGAIVSAERKAIGQVTSTVSSPTHGPIALAVLRKPHDEPGTQVEVAGATGLVAAKVQIP